MGKISQPEIDNIVLSRNTDRGTFRGLHFQLDPFCEVKVITCLTGSMMDYLVDLRPHSKTVGRWTKIFLDSTAPSSLVVPFGIAHGYQTHEPNTTVMYGISTPYSAEHQRVLSVLDSELSLSLDIEVSQMSDRDREGISLQEALRLFREKKN